jgi:hypothetical protein
MHDITIHRKHLVGMVPPGCRGLGDLGYAGEPDTLTVICQSDLAEVKNFKEAARARHENVNGRLKKFGILDKPWAYHRDKHALLS